jgi:hypothetical protein
VRMYEFQGLWLYYSGDGAHDVLRARGGGLATHEGHESVVKASSEEQVTDVMSCR